MRRVDPPVLEGGWSVDVLALFSADTLQVALEVRDADQIGLELRRRPAHR